MLKGGIIPWRKPWKGEKASPADTAISYTSRRAYSLINQWLLGGVPGEYLTFNEVKKLGGSVKKGAKAGMVIFYTKASYTKKNDEGEDEVVTYPLLKYYHVFHIDQCEGIRSKTKPEEVVEIETDGYADAIIADYIAREGIKFQNDKHSDRAFYCPATDEVVVPMVSQYAEVAEYYSTTFHELTHSTGKATRCNREDEKRGSHFGNEQYSREELVAEIGASMLCSRTGVAIEKAFRNSVAYIQSWLKALKNDPAMIVWAAGRAEKAAAYIMNEA
jgi:antirestriction protein ArdC